MAKYINADALIEDLQYDIELDARTLDDLDFADANERELVQLDKDIKQNTISILEQTPTADVRENVHAHWEKAYGDSRLMCSVCKCREIVPTIMGEPIVWGFCPNCGARMDERRDDGD